MGPRNLLRNVSEFLNWLLNDNLSGFSSDYPVGMSSHSKKFRMENSRQVEVIFFSKYSLTNLRHKQQVRWLGTIAQSAIEVQNEKVKKLFLRTLKGTPAIYLS
jgi:hypothetical protein